MSDIITKYFPQITAQQQAQFNALYNLYAEWNAKINVISRKDITNFIRTPCASFTCNCQVYKF